jgi:hypothetical protein
MPSLLVRLRKLISDAIWDEVDVSKDNKWAKSGTVIAKCISLEAAREFIDVNRLAVVIPEDLANAIQAEANLSVDDPRAGLAPGAEGVTWSELKNPEPTDNRNRDHTEDRTKSGDELPSAVVSTTRTVENSKIDSADADETKIEKDAIDSHDQQVRAGGVLAKATSADVELPLKVIKLGPFFAAEALQMPRAVQPCFLSPELFFASVPAAPNISYQRPLPTIDGVKCALTAGPNAIACICVNIISTQHTASCRQSVQGGISCRYRPIAVGRLIDAPQRLPPEKTSTIRAPRTPKTEIIEKTTYSIQCGSQLL